MKSQRDESATRAEPLEAEPQGEDLLSILLDDIDDAAAPAPLPERIDGIVVGWLSQVNTASGAQVTVARGAGPIPARALVAVAAGDEGREVALMFEAGDPTKPMIMGFVQRLAPVATTPSVESPTPVEEEASDESPVQAIDVQADGERVVLSGKKEIVLQCGKASITLTRAGKILIRGAYVLTRSSGVNRILGGTVQIN
jgi:Domain of unknown function (DUF6484)